MLERFSQSFRKNPWAWILGGLLAFSVYSNYQIGSKVTETCLAITALMEGYWELGAEGQHDIDAMVREALAEGQVHDQLMQEDSYEGRTYRWYRSSTRVIERLCAEKLAEPDQYDDRD